MPIDLLAQSAVLFCPYGLGEFSGYAKRQLSMELLKKYYHWVGEINWCKHDATTPSGCACHPSTGGELAVRYFFNSPSISVPVISPPQEGNYPPLPVIVNLLDMQDTTPSGCACHPSTGGELAVRYFFNSPSISVPVISSPQEGN